MKSASDLSAQIRAKKKKMQEDPDVIDSGGSPSMDAQDLGIAKRQEATDSLDENMPAPHSDQNDQSPAAEMDEEKKAQRKNRIQKMLK